MVLKILWLLIVCLGVSSDTSLQPELEFRVKEEILRLIPGIEWRQNTWGSDGTASDRNRSRESTTPAPIPVVSNRGIPGEDFPNYAYAPETSFTCSDKPYIPGFYADTEADCQVFHVCWHRLREDFLCPIGTIFNQVMGKCDYWYNSNCSQAEDHYNVSAVISESYPPDTSEGNPLAYGSVIYAWLLKYRSLRSRILIPSPDKPLSPEEQRLNEEVERAISMLPYRTIPVFLQETAESRVGLLKDKDEASLHDTHYFAIVMKLLKKLDVKSKYSTREFDIIGANEDQLLKALVLNLAELLLETYKLLEK